MLFSMISLDRTYEMDLTVTKIEVESHFAGRLGRKVQETLFVRATDGKEFSITLNAYHTRFGEPKRTFKVGDHITASSSGWKDRATVTLR